MKTKTKYLLTAFVVAIIVSSCTTNKKNEVNLNELVSTYMKADELPTFIQRGGADSLLSLIETNFEAKNYKAVTDIIDFNESKFDLIEYELLYIYKGISYSEQKLYGKAYNTLSNKEIFKDSFYKQMADWYLVLTLMKSKNKIDGKKFLEELSKDETHYKNVEAKNLLIKMPD